jgi:hypothetical protein
MADLLPGSMILGNDTPPTVSETDTTANNNISNTSVAAGTPEVGVAFIAPTTGRIVVHIGGGLRDNGGTNRVFLSLEIYTGSDATGTQIVTASVASNGISSCGVSAGFQYVGRTIFEEGLTAGATYYARTVQYVDAGTTADIASRSITVQPAT